MLRPLMRIPHKMHARTLAMAASLTDYRWTRMELLLYHAANAAAIAEAAGRLPKLARVPLLGDTTWVPLIVTGHPQLHL